MKIVSIALALAVVVIALPVPASASSSDRTWFVVLPNTNKCTFTLPPGELVTLLNMNNNVELGPILADDVVKDADGNIHVTIRGKIGGVDGALEVFSWEAGCDKYVGIEPPPQEANPDDLR